MAGNAFEDSRIAAGTLNRGGQKPGAEENVEVENSTTISRDDVRDGVEAAPAALPKRYRRILSASTLAGDRVHNATGEDLGKIEEIMLDIPAGRIAYAVLSFGGFLGLGNKLFAVPWSALRVDEAEHEFILEIKRETLENAPGFDKDNWPDMTDQAFGETIRNYYGRAEYWEHTVTDAGDYTGENPWRDKSAEYEPTTGYQARGRQ